jgi:hypothetical protein
MDTKELLLRLYFSDNWEQLGLTEKHAHRLNDLVTFVWSTGSTGAKTRLFKLTSKGKKEAERLLVKYGRRLFAPRGIALEVRRWVRVEATDFSAVELRSAFFELARIGDVLVHSCGYGYDGYLRVSIADPAQAVAAYGDALKSGMRPSKALAWLVDEYLTSSDIIRATSANRKALYQEFVLWDDSIAPTR